MKARVKDTGLELEVHLVDKQARYIGSDGVTYWEEDLDFGIEDKNNPDYWTRLEHQYAGMAMHGILSNSEYLRSLMHTKYNDYSAHEVVPNVAMRLAHTLVEKYKKEEK